MDGYTKIHTDVLVIGTGAAGLRAGIEAKTTALEVLAIGKRARRDAHTVLAAGGINAALGNVDPEDSWEQHFADTLIESYFLSNPRMVEILAQESPAAIHDLEEWGCNFARTPTGKIDQRYFGAHKYRRTCYAGDYTGREILFALDNQAAESGVSIHAGKYVTHLLVDQGKCLGAMAFDLGSGEHIVYEATATVLASGGHTRLWSRSTSRLDENTGDGCLLALEAGCTLADMELVQFHPTGMVAPEEKAGTLITEAVRGEGGILLNSAGERFMHRYDPERMELSSRDRVALAIYTEILEGRASPNGGVYLDISHRGKEFIEKKLPRMQEQFENALHLDISEQPMEVAPTAHYSMGGVVVDPETGHTGLDGLYAAGEVTAGLHGANRLGGNSLAETMVFGRRAGEAAAGYAQQKRKLAIPEELIRSARGEIEENIREGTVEAGGLQAELGAIMWENCGVVRDEERLRQGLEKISRLRSELAELYSRPDEQGHQAVAKAFDLKAALVTAEASMLAARERRESRGAHQRYDHPDVDPDLRVNFAVTREEDGQLSIARRPVAPIPEYLEKWLQAEGDYDLEGRLLE